MLNLSVEYAFDSWRSCYKFFFVQVMAAHICYLLAEANIEQYSESARLCLVGADHLKYPRTYASPQAIQVFVTLR